MSANEALSEARDALLDAIEALEVVRFDEQSCALGLWQGPFIPRRLTALRATVQKLNALLTNEEVA